MPLNRLQFCGSTDAYFLGGAYRHGFNGLEGDDEIKGQGNSYTSDYREYDPRVCRWLSLDPFMTKFPWQSPYAGLDNNPILLRDPTGGETEGDYYDINGKHLGSDGIDDNKVYRADKKNEDGTFANSQELLNPDGSSLGHDNFLKISAKALNEDSDRDGTFAVASAMYNYMSYKGYSGSKYLTTDHSYAPSSFKEGANKEQAFAAVINAYTGGADLSRGATHWDGRDVLTDGESHYRFEPNYSGTKIGVFIPKDLEDEVLRFEQRTLSYFIGHNNSNYVSKTLDGLLYSGHSGVVDIQMGSLWTVTAGAGSSIFYKYTPDTGVSPVVNQVGFPTGLFGIFLQGL